MFTTLAVIFVILLLVVVLYGFGIIVRKPPTVEELSTELCSLCLRRTDKRLLVERQVGDSRLYYFCADCIQRLEEDMEKTSSPSA